MTDNSFESYYGRPILKEPVWKWQIPAYFFAGGIGGASGTLSGLALLTGHERLGKVSSYVGAAGDVLSPAFLITDLGRPERFLNMLRVFKPTSPMNMGSWILFTSGPAFSLGAVRGLLGWFPRLGRAAAVTSALFGPALATYTAILLADTAVPVWHEARDHLPWLFAGSAAMSAGALATLVTPASHAGPARRLAMGGALAALIATQRMEQHLGEIGEPYRTGRAGGLMRAAKGLIAGGALAVAAGGRRRPGWTLGGAAALVAGAVSERWGVYKAGFASARDPKYVVAPQRRRLAARGGVPSRRNPR